MLCHWHTSGLKWCTWEDSNLHAEALPPQGSMYCQFHHRCIYLVAVDGNAPPLKASKAPGPAFIRNGIKCMFYWVSQRRIGQFNPALDHLLGGLFRSRRTTSAFSLAPLHGIASWSEQWECSDLLLIYRGISNGPPRLICTTLWSFADFSLCYSVIGGKIHGPLELHQPLRIWSPRHIATNTRTVMKTN